MIKRATEQPIRERKELRGGVGTLYFHDFLQTEESYGAGHLFSKTVIPAGASIGEHRHDGEFEVYYILTGTAEVTDNGTVATLHAGDMHLCSSGDSHALRNPGPENLEVIMLILYENPTHA